jgi:hypothetical protein
MENKILGSKLYVVPSLTHIIDKDIHNRSTNRDIKKDVQ